MRRLLLVGLIIRGVAFDFRAKVPVHRKHRWNKLFLAGSLTASLDRSVDNVEWAPDGRALYIQYDDHAITKVARVSLNGRLEPVAQGKPHPQRDVEPGRDGDDAEAPAEGQGEAEAEMHPGDGGALARHREPAEA